MIAFIGDVHAKFHRLVQVMDETEADVYVQVGDFGLWPDRVVPPLPGTLYMVEGNHEYYPYLAGIESPTEIRPGLIYVPRGTVLELDGRRIGFLGGADSPDRAQRIEGVSWFREETISYEDMLRFPADAAIDVLVTHTPPAFVVRQMLGRIDVDPSARAVEAVWDGLGRPRLVCGHMHERHTAGPIEVLGELDVLRLP